MQELARGYHLKAYKRTVLDQEGGRIAIVASFMQDAEVVRLGGGVPNLPPPGLRVIPN